MVGLIQPPYPHQSSSSSAGQKSSDADLEHKFAQHHLLTATGTTDRITGSAGVLGQCHAEDLHQSTGYWQFTTCGVRLTCEVPQGSVLGPLNFHSTC